MRRGFELVEPQLPAAAGPALLPQYAKRIVPFKVGTTQYIMVMYATGSSDTDPVRLKQIRIAGSDIEDVTEDLDNGSAAYFDFTGWESQDCASMQFAQTDERLYFVTSDSPMHTFRRNGENSGWTLEAVGDSSNLNPVPGPVCRSYAPPFSFTVEDSGTTATGNSNETNSVQHIVSDRPIFQTNDAGNATGSSFVPAIFLLNYKEDSKLYRIIGYDNPREADAILMNEGSPNVTDEAAVTDWVGPWKPISVDLGTVTINPGGGGNLVAGNYYTLDSSATVDWRPGWIFVCPDPADDDFDCVIEVVGVIDNATNHTAVGRCVTNIGATKRQENDGVLLAEYTVFAPQFRVDGQNLFMTQRREIANTPSNATNQAFSDWLYVNRDYASTDADITYNGGWIQVDGAYTADVFGCEYAQVNRPSDQQLWTGICQIRANDFDGHPSAIAFHQNRIFVSGYFRRPQSVTGSATGQYDDWSIGANDDDSLFFTLLSDFGDQIQWMKSGGDLLVGTERAEWAISGVPITPTQIGSDPQSAYGSAAVQPEFAGAAVMFVGRDGRSLREMEFRFEVDRYQAPDLADLSEHFFERTSSGFQGMKRMVFAQYPDPVVYTLREDGSIIALSYKRENRVTAWSSWTLGGEVLDLCVTREDDTDHVWAITGTPGASVTYTPLARLVDVGDSWLDYDHTIANGGGGTSVTGLPAIFYNQTVYVHDSDGIERGTMAVNGSGAGTLPVSGLTNLSVGFRYTYELEAQVPQPDNRAGDSLGRKKTYHAIRALIQQARYLDAVSTVDGSELTNSMVDLGAGESLQTEESWVRSNFSNSISDIRTIKLRSTNGPCEISGVNLTLETDGVD